MDRHNEILQNNQLNGDKIRAIFIGSSVMENWGREGIQIWNSKYEPLGAVNYGIGGDRTEHMLWRILNGEIDGVSPKLIVIYIGSNNIPIQDHSPDDIVRGILTIITTIREKLPNTAILYTTIFPRADISPITDAWTKITTVTNEVLKVNDNVKINIMNIFDDFIVSWGDLKDELYLSDNLHLTAAGYGQWDASMTSTFYPLWNENQI